MKTEHLILLGGLGVALILAMRPSGSKRKTGSGTTATGATEIKVEGDAYGWRYFSDGTAIDAYGNYYKNGQLVYNPMM